MQKTFSIITMISLFLAGCSHEQPCQDSLLQAERIIDQHPDSAMLLLAPLNTDSLATTQDSALYGLLFTEAIHRKGLTFNDDTLIAQSENYYRNVGNNDCRLARSLLHHAIVRYSQQSYAEAFALIKEAEEMAAQLGDPAFCYELYAVLGDMYDNAYDKTATLHYYQRSLDAARQAHNDQWAARMLNNMATTFDQLEERDSFMYYMQQVEPLLPKLDGVIRAVALCNMGSYQLKEGDTIAAKQSLLQALKLTYLDKANYLLANIAKGEGDFNRATNLWYQTLQAEELDLQIKAHEQLIRHFSQQQDFRRSSELSQRLNDLYRRSSELSDRTGIHGMQQQYERAQAEQRQYRLVIILLGIASLLLLLLLSLSYYHRWRIRRYNQLVSDISIQLTDMEQLRQKLNQQQQADQQQQLLAADIIARLRTLAQRGQPASEADWTALVDAYRQHCPQFLTMLSSINSLQSRELNVCLLIRLRFQPSEVAVLTASSPQSVTNLRVRLLQKVFHLQGGARDFDEHLRDC